MPVDAQAGLVAEFEKCIEQNGGHSAGYGWYAGVTSDPQHRLFRQHGVDRNDAAWIYAKAPSDDDARAIERHLIEKGAKGRSGGGDESAINVIRVPHQPVHGRVGSGLGKRQVRTAAVPGLRYNLELRVETLYPVPDCGLPLTSAFDVATGIPVTATGVPATVAATAALGGDTRTAGKVGISVSLIAPAPAPTVRPVRNVLTAKSMVRRIRKRFGLKSDGAGGKP